MIGGLVIRFVPLGQPSFVVKYAGSMLWALMIYWIVSTALSATRISTVALLTVAITISVELFKMHHSPALDAFRLTLPGILLLGRFFSVWDIVVYSLAITFGAFADRRMRSIRI
jgi:hypothetical protein